MIGALAALTAIAALAGGKKANDPVLMTVNGKPVPLSEFEYLYHKNNSQQLQPQTIDEYVDMFVTYKLKVADAEAAGIDTTQAFLNEFNGYRNDLADPYLVDKEYEDSLLHVAYSHYQEAVDVSHIMVPLLDMAGKPTTKALLDSIRQLVIDGADFGKLARRYSSDQSARVNGGHLGYIIAGQYPYEFEEVAYNTAPGQVSEIFPTRFGYHFIKAGDRKANPGEVHTRHILLMTRGLSPEQSEAKHQKIDSIYAALKAGADFAEAARMHSDDTGSGRNGGDLPWFSLGRMVPEFEETAFALADGEMSEPFKSAYGWHIVERLGHRGLPPFEDVRDNLRKAFDRDVRSERIAKRRVEKFEQLYPVKIDASTEARVQQILAGGVDSTSVAQLKAMDNLTAATVGKRIVTVADVAAKLEGQTIVAESAFEAYNSALAALTDEAVLAQARENLELTNPDFRNLIGEYRDGMLLFEISNRNVWQRASADTEGLQRYFEANRGNYTWQKPHFKGWVVLATTDSVRALAEQMAKGRQFANTDSLNSALRQQFGRDAKAEFVVAGQGDNPIVDYVAFGGAVPEAQKGRRFNSWFALEGRIIDAPEEASDVKGAVSTDYQQELERQWVEELHAKYPVKINKKILKKVK